MRNFGPAIDGSPALMTPSDRTQQWRIEFADAHTSALFEPATRDSRNTVFVCAHGAGGHMNDRSMIALARELRDCGVDIVRFNFLYREKGSARPDPMSLLKQCVAAVVARVRAQLHIDRLIIGGRSMGGRAASMLAAEGLDCDGLLLLAYPLHPAGKPEQLRDAHLPQIRIPVLCLNGTHDALCRQDLMEQVFSQLSDRWKLHWLEGADHSFHVLKSSGRTDADVMTEVGKTTAAWLDHLPSGEQRQ